MTYASLSLSKTGKTVTGVLSPVDSNTLITQQVWTWSLNGVIEGGNSSSCTFSNYGAVTVTVSFNATDSNGLHSSMAQGSTTLSESGGPTDPEGTTTDVFANKPIIIPPECTGDIQIRASITDLIDEDPYKKQTNESTAIHASVCMSNVIIGASSSIDLVFDKSGLIEGTATVTDSKLQNLEYLPAFYNTGIVSVYNTIGETADEDQNFDVTWDMKMMCPEMPSWYEGNLSYDSEIFKNIITASNTETEFAAATEYTTMPQPTWSIATWSQLPPFYIKWYTEGASEVISSEQTSSNKTDYEFEVDLAATVSNFAIKRAVLPNFNWKFTITNNVAAELTLGTVSITWQWNYSPSGTFMNMRTASNHGSGSGRLLTLPRGAEATRNAGMDFPIYAVLEGYQPNEVTKVYAVFNKWEESIEAFYPTTLEMTAIDKNSFGTDDTQDFANFLYKVSGALPTMDFTRITNGSWMRSDTPDIITPQRIAKEEIFRTIKISIVDDKSIDDSSAIIAIDIVPNDSTDSKITATELLANVSKIHFFNTEYSFAPHVEIPRSEIAPLFRETLWSTYEDAVVLESVLSEPLHYLNFSVNAYETYVPIYDGQTISFSDEQRHCIDGVKGSELFFIDGVTENIINVKNPDKHKYKFQLDWKYTLYQDMYVMTDEDLAAIGVM